MTQRLFAFRPHGDAYALDVDYIALGRELAAMRMAAGLTQADVARELKEKRQTIGHWETAHVPVPMHELERLLPLYGRRLVIRMPETGTPTVEIEVPQDVAELAAAAEPLTAEQRTLLRELAEVLPKLPPGTLASLPMMVNGWRRDFLYARARSSSQ